MDKRQRYFKGLSEDKKVRRIIKECYKQKPARSVAPLWDEDRSVADGDEAYIDFGFLPEGSSDWSDEDIVDYLDDGYRMTIRSPYDCTGRPFTRWFHWHRNPCGRVSFTHHVGIDV